MIASLQPSGAVPGSCGYGAINETSWPFGAVASVTSNDSLVAGLPMSGCGTCFKLQCEDQVGSQFEQHFECLTVNIKQAYVLA